MLNGTIVDGSGNFNPGYTVTDELLFHNEGIIHAFHLTAGDTANAGSLLIRIRI